MGELVDGFAGRVSGELIRAADWNGFVAAVETALGALETTLGTRIATLEGALAEAQARLGTAEATLTDLGLLGAAVRARMIRLDLSAPRTAFAIGEMGEIVARVGALTGGPLPDGARPWVDFVTVWGALRAAPGFTARSGGNGRTISVQVNEEGIARAFLRADHADAFAFEQEAEVEAVLSTAIGGRRIADLVLEAETPAASTLAPAYAAISLAYDRQDTPVMRSYLDTWSLRNTSLSVSAAAGARIMNWRDHHATVLAFAKPDDSPGTGDGALASASIRIAFRDWVYPWLVTDYLPPSRGLVEDLRGRLNPRIRENYALSVNGLLDTLREEVTGRGLIGQQRILGAAQTALGTLGGAGSPVFLANVVETVAGGITMQQSLLMSQAATPVALPEGGAVRAFGLAAVQGQTAALAELGTVRAETAAAETRILDNVRAENARMSADLLAEDGPVRRAETLAQTARTEAVQAKELLGGKANFDLVTQLLTARGGG